MFNSVYPTGRDANKWTDCVFSTLGAKTMVTICCEECRRVLTEYSLKSDKNGAMEVTVPATFCVCSMSQPDLVALVQSSNIYTQMEVWTQLLANIAQSVLISGGHLGIVEECIEAARLSVWQDAAQSVLRERHVQKIKESWEAGTYDVASEDIAEWMIRRIVETAVAA
jgi:hypothetical protein